MSEKSPLSRRDAIKTSALTVGALAWATTPAHTQSSTSASAPFRYCLNTSTIRGQELSLEEEIDVTAKAGYSGIEPWLRKIHEHKENGGSLSDIKKRLEDLGLTVESAIGFANWVVDDDEKRTAALEEAKRDMDALAQIGALRIAAPPAGANKSPGLNLDAAAERYRQLLELGDEIGVTPQVEIWGPSANLHKIGEAMYVAGQSGHPKACILTDVYHLYKGGNDFAALNLLSKHALQVMHMNDYPADPPRNTIKDSDRVYPGDGIAPIPSILQTMLNNGASPVLSLELFNKSYWEKPALETAKTGLEKMKAVVATALA
ncbi:MAG: sugar phosphate isomerase/epimerase family protein [Verrucomicrobiota bacterium]